MTTNILPQVRYDKLNIIQKINAKSNSIMRGNKGIDTIRANAYMWPAYYTQPLRFDYK